MDSEEQVTKIKAAIAMIIIIITKQDESPGRLAGASGGVAGTREETVQSSVWGADQINKEMFVKARNSVTPREPQQCLTSLMMMMIIFSTLMSSCSSNISG